MSTTSTTTTTATARDTGVDRNISLLSDANLDAGRGGATALVTPDDGELTYEQLHALISRFAVRVRDLGVRRGERVLMVMDNSPAFHAAFLGSIRIGAVPVPVNFMARDEDFGFFLADSYATLAVCDAAFEDKVRPFAEELSVPLAVVGSTDAEHAVDGWLADGVDHVEAVETHPDDPGFWLYSSGSTGRPKGVVHLQHDVLATCEQYAGGILSLTEDDRCFSTTPLFHAYGLGNGLSFPMWAGATAIQLAGRPTPTAALDKIERHRPTVLFSVPALYNAMLDELDDRDVSSVRVGASAAEALPGEIWRQWHDATGIEILDGIGSTEMLHIYCSNRQGQVRPGSSGWAVPGYELQLRDPDGGVLADEGEAVGDLWVRGDSALAYYWHNHDRTRQNLQGHWFFSGDRYRRDEDGFYSYEGRADDMMKVKGLWVSPIDIENRLIEHERVTEAAVVGVPREGMLRIKAHVILADDDGDDELVAELQEWCKDALLRYQFPHEVEFVQDFPRTATGKIQRFKLRGEAA